MNSPLARGLRRIVDVLQRSLFDEGEPSLPPSATGAPSVVPTFASPETAAAPLDLSRHPRANRELRLEQGRLAFQLRRSRRRSIGFVVGAEGLVVSAPRWVLLRDVDAAVREKAGWIFAKLAGQGERAARIEAGRMVWADGAELRYLGQTIRIALDARHGLASGEVELEVRSASDEGDEADGPGDPRRLLVGLPRDAAPERLRDAVQSWLQREARARFQARCDHFAAELGVEVKRLSLSSAATRWGSANANGSIRLHWRLIQHAPATIDYVVAHELAHLREMNHGPRFWAVVRSVVPGYESERGRLGSEPLAAWD